VGKIRRKIRMLDQEERKRAKRQLHSLVGSSGLWPLDAPGMPPPGPDFLALAKNLGDDTVYEKKGKGVTEFKPGDKLKELYRRALREAGFNMTVQVKPGYSAEVTFVPGHIWGQHAAIWMESLSNHKIECPKVDGPHPADVMLIGKIPWKEETQELRNLVGASGEVLTELIKKLHIRGAAKWYVTNLVKFCPPDGNTTLKAGWVKDCAPLLAQELRIVRPKYILCIGADSSKALLGSKFGVGYMDGRVVQHDFPVHLSHEDEPEFHRCQVMTVLHPAEVAREPSKGRILERGMGRFSLLVTGVNFDKAEEDLDHRVIDTYEDAEEWAQEVEAYFQGVPLKDRLVAWDAEWQGQHPLNPDAYLRTVQVSWAPKHSVCFKIAHVGGKLAFRDRDGKPAIKRLAKLLNCLMKDKRAVGHFLVADLEWLHYYGIDPIRSCEVPLDPDDDGRPGWVRFRNGQGWYDTAMAAHAIEETASLGLESLGMRYTTAPRWDIDLEDWKKEYCKQRGIKPSGLEGYGDCPDHVLHPYANYDADVTLRIAQAQIPLLDADYEGNCCWEPFWESMIAQPVILDIHKNGIKVDRKRIDDLTEKFMTARHAQEEKIKDWAKWPDFNIRSTQQVREFLFGEALNGKIDNWGQNIRLRPKGAKSLYIEPLLDTSKPPRRWEDLKAKGLTKEATPGTGKMILGILAQENLNVAEQINWVRDYRFLDQVLKSVLRPPVEEEGEWLKDDDGFYEYEAGLASCIDADGRVRTHLYPTAETGRWKSSRPNLQNISKSRDPDYERLLGKEFYKHKLRSVLKADGWDGAMEIPPRPKHLQWILKTPGEEKLRSKKQKKKALIEFDYTGAELYGMAIMSGDKNMIEHAERALYPDEGFDENGKPVEGGKFPHPLYYDIHSNVAVLAFQLKCKPTKSGLKEIGKSHFRTLAKNVIFGIAYGRGAKAIALQAKEQGVKVTADEAQMVIDTIFEMYPGLVPFFEEAKKRAKDHKWLCHCFGRFRRFPSAADFKLEGEFERQAMNFPIQGMIASAVDRGLARLRKMIYDYGLEDDIGLLLQIHDAGLLEVSLDLIDWVVKELIPYAMRDCVPIYPSTLDGQPTGKGPYHLGLEIVVEKHWGEKFSLEECEKYGIPTKFAAKVKK